MSRLFDFVPSWVWALVIAVLLTAVGVAEMRASKAKRELAELKADIAESARKAEEEARAREQAMQADADKLRQEKDREIRDLNARAAALADSLRQRPNRATQGGGVPGAAGARQAGPGCSGSTLPREDAEFLAGEAARADGLRAALRQCLDQYEALKH